MRLRDDLVRGKAVGSMLLKTTHAGARLILKLKIGDAFVRQQLSSAWEGRDVEVAMTTIDNDNGRRVPASALARDCSN